MNDDVVQHLKNAIGEAELADRTFVTGSVSNHFLEIVTTENDEVLVRGNGPGLVHFGLSVLKLALQNDGAHHHFDEAGIVDHCDRPLIVSKREADWET